VAALIAARPRAEREADRLAAAEAAGAEATAGPETTAGPEATAEPEATAGAEATAASRAAATFRPGGTSLGETLARTDLHRQLDRARSSKETEGSRENKVSGIESRLHLMVRQDMDGIHRMLPGVLRQAGSEGVPVDYACLLRDLSRWQYGRDTVATRWLTDYYRTLSRGRAAERRPSETPDQH
jgi:CRISPR system Cascade subunit CasB